MIKKLKLKTGEKGIKKANQFNFDLIFDPNLGLSFKNKINNLSKFDNMNAALRDNEQGNLLIEFFNNDSKEITISKNEIFAEIEFEFIGKVTVPIKNKNEIAKDKELKNIPISILVRDLIVIVEIEKFVDIEFMWEWLIKIFKKIWRF